MLYLRFNKFFSENNESDVIYKKELEKFFFEVTHEILSRTTFSRRLEKSELYNDSDEDKQIGIDQLLSNGTFTSCYPLHENYGDNMADLSRDRGPARHSLRLGYPPQWLANQRDLPEAESDRKHCHVSTLLLFQEL